MRISDWSSDVCSSDLGNVAQQIFWYTAFTAFMVAPKSEGNNTVDDEGNPPWRMAPSPHGPYWKEGMKLGYQDTGSWTILKATPLERAKAAWLYAQFVVSKTVVRSEEHTSDLQSLMSISYAVFCL